MQFLRKRWMRSNSRQNLMGIYVTFLNLYNVYAVINSRGDYMKYYSIGEFSKLIGKNSQTLREWIKKIY